MNNETKCGDCNDGVLCLVDDLCDKHFAELYERRLASTDVCHNHFTVKWTDCPCSDSRRARYERVKSNGGK